MAIKFVKRFSRAIYQDVLNKNPSVFRELVKDRVAMCNRASARVRYATMLTALFAIGLSLVMYDYFFTWNRKFAFEVLEEVRSGGPPRENPIRDKVIDEWMSTQVYELPFLGIEIMASDLPLLAPIALLLCSSWLFFIVRR